MTTVKVNALSSVKEQNDLEPVGSVKNVKRRRKEGMRSKCCSCVDAQLKDEVSMSKLCTDLYTFSFAVVVILLSTVDGKLKELRLLVHSNENLHCFMSERCCFT